MTDNVEPMGAEDQAASDINHKSVVADAWRLLFRNYWSFAILGVATTAAYLLLAWLNFIPVLGQLLSAFLYGIVHAMSLIAALYIARRSDNVAGSTVSHLSGARAVEYGLMLLPLGLISVIGQWIYRTILFGGLFTGTLESIGFVLLPISILFFVFVVYVTLRLSFTAYYAAGVPADASIDPLKRLSQSWKLTSVKTWAFVGQYFLIMLVAALLMFIPFIGPTLLSAVFATPFELAGIVVIYHRLTSRPIPGLEKREKTEADKAADEAAPL